MRFGKRRHGMAIVAAAVLSAGGAARGDQPDPTQQDLLETVRALQARVAQLEAQQKQSNAGPETAIADKTIAEVQKDAERRSHLVSPGGFTAGYKDDKFLIQSEDGNFVLHPYAQFLFRHATTYRQDSKESGEDDIQSGFEVRRLKLGFDGNMFSKDLTYHFLWATDRKSGNLVLEEGFGDYKFTDALSVRAGQFKHFYAHESQSSSKKLLVAERSLLNDVFTGGDNFVQGVALTHLDGPLKATISYTDGLNNPNQNFEDFPENKSNFGFATRAEFKLFGDWKSYEDFTAMKNKQDLLVFGGALDYTEAGDTGTLSHTADAQYEFGKIGLYGAYLGRYISGGDSNRYDYGAVVQGGYIIDNTWEPFFRYSYIHFAGQSVDAGEENDVQEISFGLNYYIRGHAAKVTADLTWLPSGSPVDNDGGSILATPGDNDEFIVRVQFALLL